MSDALRKDSAFERDPRRKQEIASRPVIDDLYREVWGDGIKIYREGDIGRIKIHGRPDARISDTLDFMGCDVAIVFPSSQPLYGQEKSLSYEERIFRTITISEHSFSKCAAQFYFCGYLNEDNTGFDPWIIANWASVVLAANMGQIAWSFRPSNTPRRYPSFWHTIMDDMPYSCVIAHKP